MSVLKTAPALLYLVQFSTKPRLNPKNCMGEDLARGFYSQSRGIGLQLNISLPLSGGILISTLGSKSAIPHPSKQSERIPT